MRRALFGGTRACATVRCRHCLGAQTAPATRRAVAGRFATSVFMLVGPGANTTVQIGRDGVFVVDPQTGATSAIAAGGDSPAVRQAGALHRQHDDRRRSHRRERSAGEIGSDARRRQHAAGHVDGHRRCADLRARERAQPADRVRRIAATRCRPTPTSSSRRTCSSTARRCSCCTSSRAHRRRHDGLLPPQRRDQRGRRVHAGSLSDDRPGARRQHRRACSPASTTSSSSPCPTSTKRAGR